MCCRRRDRRQATVHRTGSRFVKDDLPFENVEAVIDRPKHFGNNRRKRAINDRPYNIIPHIAQHHRQKADGE